MTSIGGISVLVLILVLSFVIDRTAKATLFALSFVKVPWVPQFNPELVDNKVDKAKAKRSQTLLYFVLATALSVGVVVYYGDIRVLKALGGYDGQVVLDTVVTGIVLICGSELLSRLFKIESGGEPGSSGPQPVEITGRLTLEREALESEADESVKLRLQT